MRRTTKVLIVDDSALVRQTLREILSSDPHIEVVGTARDPIVALDRMKKQLPDVITLDIEVPRMDGLTFLKRIMTQNPIPIVVCSYLTEENSDAAVKAMQYGAIEIITKPKLGTKQFLEESRVRICDAVKAADLTRARRTAAPRAAQTAPKLSADAVIPRSTRRGLILRTDKIVVVGASTGGTDALRRFLEAMPADAPGIVIVQHMPEHFTKAFSKRLDGLCTVTVKEAEDNDTVIRGRALIAPGNRHTLLKRSGTRYSVEVKDGPLVNRHRPSVDMLFRSAACTAGQNSIGVIMTGMGDDGARGMKELKDAGATTFAQDETTCVVFGMPNEAIKRGGVEKVLPLDGLAVAVLNA